MSNHFCAGFGAAIRNCIGGRLRSPLRAMPIVALASLTATPALAQTSVEDPDNSFTVALNQDSFFGFYPTFNGLLEMNDDMDFSFYGIMWTKPAFGLNPTNTGDDLWTEFGAGVNLHFMNDRLMVKPQLGITNGALLSGGDLDDNGNVQGANFADGIVPSLTINYNDATWEAEWYSGYYAALRDRNEDAALDFFHVWANAGYKITPYMSVGAHWEWLDNPRNTYPGGAEDEVYMWLGGYVQFSLPKGMFTRFSAGSDISDNGEGDFYKMTVGMSF